MSLEQTVDNLEIRYANAVTFVGTSNTMIDTTTGRIQTKGIQHNSNVITDVSGPHGRGAATLKKYPEIDFAEGKFEGTPTGASSDLVGGPYIQGGYEVSGSRSYYDSGNPLFAWQVFSGERRYQSARSDYTAADGGYVGTIQQTIVSGSAVNGEWLQLKTPNKIKLKRFTLALNLSGYDGRKAKSFVIAGSDDGTTWVTVSTHTDTPLLGGANGADDPYDSNSIEYYKYHRLIVTHTHVGAENGPLALTSWGIYGYEEDPPAGDHSVDTTFMSRFNNPHTTGVQVLVDGATGVGTNQISGGPDPSGNQSTYVTDGKYWTLNGTLTSNLSVEANTFLEGDQPHAVSVWFNSSNLEANVSNTCVFSVSDQEKLDSVNLDLQSNTWHNLTYAYQGEGGSRVTYLDGRKVAEDQAEDTFGDYPPFAMTGYSQGGYVVSASSTAYTGTDWNSWHLYDDRPSGNNGWHGDNNFNSSDNFAYNGNANLGGQVGEWNKLEMPHKLVLNYFKIRNRGAVSDALQAPEDFKIIGSNDDVNWTVLFSVTGVTWSGPGVEKIYSITSNSIGYKYLAFLCTRTVGSGALTLNNISYYGHRENDLVRLPDPTNVLKYPHIAMTGPAQRGYVASAVEEYDVPGGSNPNYRAWEAFDDDTNSASGTGYWSSKGGAFNTSSPFQTLRSGGVFVTNVGGTDRTGLWIQLELPHKLKLNLVKYQYRSASSGLPRTGFVVGSNNGTTWEQIYAFENLTASSTTVAHPLTPSGSVSNIAYKYIRLIITHGGGGQYAAAQHIELYGTGVDSIPIQIGGGNIDKVANFRVYDKFVEEDQALEIWDAQKDEFERAKSSMTLQKGRLGIGTDEPEGRLAVLDEPHNLEEFPPRAMTGYKTYFEGHGEFCASASDEHSSNYDVQNAFNKITNRLNSSGGTTNTYYNGGEPTPRYYDSSNDYAYSGTNGLGGVMGEWVKLEFPYKANISQISILPVDVHVGVHSPEDFTIMGSSDNINWTSLRTVTGATWTAHNYNEYTLPSTTSYKYFALVVSRTVGGNQLALQELRYFGTREQGQSVLHDGQLTLTKSLNVPRIGPALDADDTPRRDRLVVEYNTSTNPTFEGAVRDTSGRGNDGIINSSVTYDSKSKNFDFAGDSDWIESPALGWTGAQQHSVSVWIKLDVMSNPNSYSIQNAWTIRKPDSTDAVSRISELHMFSSGAIEWAWNGNNNTTAINKISAGQYYHIVCVYNGGAGNVAASRRMWINGVEETFATVSSTASAINFYDTATFAAGYDQGINNYDLDGKMSSIKLYDIALTAEEVKTLYDMGRLGNAIKTPLQIETPVDIRGDIRYITNIRPLALRTMWDHESNGHFARGIYPITGTQGGSKVYNMLCEPDWCGGGWMCAAQLPRGKDVVTTPVNLFTAEYGDPSNLTWSNDFAVPMNIFSNNSGYDLDVMLVLLGGPQAGKAGAGGARNGGIYRGVNLTQALNTGWPTNGVYPVNISTSGLASSADGYTFVSRTPVGGTGSSTSHFTPYKANAGWRISFSSHGGADMAYNDDDINTMGWLIHTAGDILQYTYSYVHGGGGSQNNHASGNANWVAVRFFVRPKRY